ncbi:MAG TPA: transposase [Methylobacterium sp.]|nr:transposase [Methylobacterium sp.]
MARPLMPDNHWREIAPLLPRPRSRPTGGRGPIKDRAALIGILLVLRSGLPWEMRPAEMGGCGMSWGAPSAIWREWTSALSPRRCTRTEPRFRLPAPWAYVLGNAA